MSAFKKIALATAVAGTLDIADAFIFWAWKAKVSWVSISQSIASGLLGAEAYKGGHATVALGLGLHFAIMAVMATVLYIALQIAPNLNRLKLFTALIYGLGLWYVMTYVVLPLSKFPKPPKWPPVLNEVLANSLFAHIVLVGLTLTLILSSGTKKA